MKKLLIVLTVLVLCLVSITMLAFGQVNFSKPSIYLRVSSEKWVPPEGYEEIFKKTKVLRVLNSGGIEFDPATAKNNEIFEKITGIKIESIDTNDPYTKSIAMLGSRSGSIDVIYADHAMLRDFIYPGWLSELDELWDEKSITYYSPATVQPMKHNNHFYAVPKYAQVWTLHWRPDMFAEVGLDRAPDNWDELIEMSRKLTKDNNGDGSNDQWGFVFGTALDRDVHTLMAMLIMQQGGHIVDPETDKVQFNTPEAIKALEFLTKLKQEGLVPSGVTNYQLADTADLFYSKKVAMHLNKSYVWSEATGDDNQLKIHEEYSQVTPPKPEGASNSVSYMDADYLAVNKFSKNQEAAKLYVDFIRSFQSCKNEFIMEGNGSVIPALYEDYEVSKINPFFDVAVNATKNAGSEVYLQENQVSKWLQVAVVDSLNGDSTPEEALNNLQKQIDDLLSQ